MDRRDFLLQQILRFSSLPFLRSLPRISAIFVYFSPVPVDPGGHVPVISHTGSFPRINLASVRI